MKGKIREGWSYRIRFQNTNLEYDTQTKQFLLNSGEESKGIDMNVLCRYLRGKYSSFSKLKTGLLDQFDLEKWVYAQDFIDSVTEGYKTAEPFTYREAFLLEEESFKALVFGTISVSNMVSELGHERIATAGQRVKRKQYDNEGDYQGDKEYDVIYETHKVDGTALGISENLYAVRCWCTSTNEEHWIWIENEYAQDPLSAIASTFRFHENVIPHIKEMKRQGDIMVVEMSEEVEPQGNVRALTKEEYFGLMTAES